MRDAWIRRDDADVELRGDLRLGKEAYQPLFVTGDIRLVRGWYAFQGRRFDLDEGRIIFGGDVPPDPQLDITGDQPTGEYEVTVEITGRATEPALALSSEPPLEQADILSLLVFGRPARDLGTRAGRRPATPGDLARLRLRHARAAPVGDEHPRPRHASRWATRASRAGRYVTRDVFVTPGAGLHRARTAR